VICHFVSEKLLLNLVFVPVAVKGSDPAAFPLRETPNTN